MVEIICEPCSYKGDGVETDSNIVCPICGEPIFDMISKEEFDEIDF